MSVVAGVLPHPSLNGFDRRASSPFKPFSKCNASVRKNAFCGSVLGTSPQKVSVAA